MFAALSFTIFRYSRGMVRKTKSSAISAKTYRHFAIVTLALTGALALFAEGENREARAMQARADEPADDNADKEREELKRAPPTQEAEYDDRFDYADNNGSFGSPMDGAEGGFASSTFADGVFDVADYVPSGLAKNLVPDGLAELGLSSAQLAQMTEAQKQAALARLSAQRQQAMAGVRARSRMRSGGNSLQGGTD